MPARETSRRRVAVLPAPVRLIHPAPAGAVVALTAALAVILSAQSGVALGWRLALIVVSIAASQVATGAINDYVDRERDRRMGRDKPLATEQLRPESGLLLGLAALAVQLVSAAPLGPLPLALAAVGSASAQLYNVALARTPLSVLPYVVSFGVLPPWIAASVGVPLERVLTATILVIPFAAAAHLANALRDFDADRIDGSRNLAQVLGRRRARLLAAGLALGVGVGVAGALLLGGRPQPVAIGLGSLGLLAVAQGINDDRRLWYGMLAAAMLWTVAWAVSTG